MQGCGRAGMGEAGFCLSPVAEPGGEGQRVGVQRPPAQRGSVAWREDSGLQVPAGGAMLRSEPPAPTPTPAQGPVRRAGEGTS